MVMAPTGRQSTVTRAGTQTPFGVVLGYEEAQSLGVPIGSVRAPDGSIVSPTGQVLIRSAAPPAAPAATPFGTRQPDGTVIGPDGTMISPTGAVQSRPQATVPTAAPPAAPAPLPTPAQGNNPGAVYNPQTQTWNVDPATQRAAQVGAAPPAAPPQAPAAPGMTPEEYRDALAPPPLGSTPIGGRRSAPSPGMTPVQPGQGQGGTADDRLAMWYSQLGGDVNQLQRFRTGGVARYENGGMNGVQPGMNGAQPNALIGDGYEADPAQAEFDKPQRTELVIVPGAGHYGVFWAEGETPVALKGGSAVVPLPNSLEAEMKPQFLPVSEMPKSKPEEAGGDLMAFAKGGVVRVPPPSAPQAGPTQSSGGQTAGQSLMAPPAPFV